MSTVFDAAQLPGLSPSPDEATRWTAVIPAAGKGSRLGADVPKILFPVHGHPMLDWIVDLIGPFCGRLVVVASEDGRAPIAKRLAELVGKRGSVVVQPSPVGMADAVARGVAGVESDNTLVIWGDQVTGSTDTLSRCLRLHMETGAKLTLPTLVRADPYIHFERHPDGRLKHVFHRREADQPLSEGENDCGVFLFQTAALKTLLAEGVKRPEAVGRKTGEVNFLALFPFLDRVPGDVISVRISDSDETLGVNTPEDAARVNAVLAARQRRKT